MHLNDLQQRVIDNIAQDLWISASPSRFDPRALDSHVLLCGPVVCYRVEIPIGRDRHLLNGEDDIFRLRLSASSTDLALWMVSG